MTGQHNLPETDTIAGLDDQARDDNSLVSQYISLLTLLSTGLVTGRHMNVGRRVVNNI